MSCCSGTYVISKIENVDSIPTRAEVADITEVIKQQADALMFSGESAMGQYPFKALPVLRSISLRIEKWWREENCHGPRKLPVATFTSPNIVTNELCTAAASMGKFLCISSINYTSYFMSILKKAHIYYHFLFNKVSPLINL